MLASCSRTLCQLMLSLREKDVNFNNLVGNGTPIIYIGKEEVHTE
jgi:hypothetical protein